MKPVMLDDELRAKLNGMNEVLPVCEANGKTVGRFVPEDVYQRHLYQLAVQAVSASELDTAAGEAIGRKLSEICHDRLGGA